jgi:iron complex outermembrane receptor protein
MSLQLRELNRAITAALAFGSVAALSMAPAFAQDDEDGDTAQMETVEVTGSRIKRTDAEGSVPVTVIDRQQLELSGDVSVADYLRNTTFNSFGSFRPQSGSSAQSFAELSLRGLGGARTLILIDGRRAPIAPQAGQGQDLNSIPLAAVERIEILTDGASAIYGSDAIGGVVNIITRRDFSGVEMSWGMSDPSSEGGETEEGSVIFGAAGDRGNIIAGASYANRGIIFSRDSPYKARGASSFSNNFINATSAPGTLYGFVPGGFTGNPTNGSVVPGGCSDLGFYTNGVTGAGRRCLYDFNLVAADEAEIRNSALFTRGNYEINEDWSTYLNANVSRVESFGRYAPVPSSPWPGGAPFIPVGSPNHPAVRFPNSGYNPATPYFLRHRFAALGNRDTTTDANVYYFDLGFDGRIGNFDVNFGGRHVESKYLELGRNYVVGGLAQAAIANGTYNIYNPSGNDRSILDGLIATINRESTFIIEELYAQSNVDLFEMSGGVAGLAFGAEYRDESYSDIYDTLQSSGQIVGSAGNSAFGSRSVAAAYAEALFPVLENLEFNLAARYDRYSDSGSDTSPKVSVRYTPIESLVLRASYGQGFRAPTLDVLTAQPAFTADTVTDAPTCLAFGLAANCSIQINGYQLGNPNLESETSDQWSAGLAWDATDWLNMSVDYWDTQIDGRIVSIGSNQIVDCLDGSSTNCPPGLSNLPPNVSPPVPSLGLGVARQPGTGEILYVQRGSTNLGTIDAAGLDVNLRTNFDFADWGSLRNQLQVSRTFDFKVDGAEQVDLVGVPKMRAVLTNEWTWGDFTFAWNVNFIDGTRSTASQQSPEPDLDYPQRLPSWTTNDLQATWNSPWNGRFTLGVNNVADKAPVIDGPYDPTGRGFDFTLYDQYGRTPYFRYTQTF